MLDGLAVISSSLEVESQFRREFHGLEYFPVKEDLRVTAKFVAEPRKIPILNVLGQTDADECPGYVTFQLHGREWKLYPIIEEPGDKRLFFIFRDETAKKETYPAGRFLYSAMPKDGTVVNMFDYTQITNSLLTPDKVPIDFRKFKWIGSVAQDLAVGEAGGRDEAGDGALALDERVGEQRRRMHDAREVAGLEGAVAQDRADTGHDGADRIVVGRQHLAAPLPAGVVVVHHDVGERAADVDSERVAGHAGLPATLPRLLDRVRAWA